MKHITLKTLKLTLVFLVVTALGTSQETTASIDVSISGEPLAEALINQWILEYGQNAKNNIKFNSKAKNADLSIEFNNSTVINNDLKHFSIARVAILPIAKSNSAIALEFKKKGLNEDRLKSLFFDDFLGSTGKDEFSKIPYQVYTRLGDSGTPYIFAQFFGYETSNIKGNGIGGNDYHVLNAMKNDDNAVSFNALNILYDLQTRQSLQGFAILPVDLNGNGKVSEDEVFYQDLDTILEKLQNLSDKDIHNIPIAQLQIVVNVNAANEDTLNFLNWILENGQKSLSNYGFLQPDDKTLQKERLIVNQLVSNRN